MAKKQNTNRIGELRLNRRWSQGELADRCNAHWVTISKLERGQMQLTQDWMERLGEALGVHPAEILSDPPLFRTVYVRGGIVDAAKLTSYNIIGEDEDGQTTETSDMTFSVQFGAPEPDRTVWYLVDSEAFYPFLREGDFVRFTYPAVHDVKFFLGRMCLIDISQTEPVRLSGLPFSGKFIGIPTRGSTAGLFDIQIHGKGMITDVAIDDMAYMSMMISNPDCDVYEDGSPKP